MENETNIVKQTCKKLGITQKQLAERIGAGENTVSGWARDISPIPPTIIKLLELLIVEQKYNAIKNAILETEN
jgi:transcriptional regulator with XRE-family HTH domain